MIVVCDVEANALENPTQIWVIVCKDIATNEYAIFRKVTEDASEKERFRKYAAGVEQWIGHNFLEYDAPTINDLLGSDTIPSPADRVCDTLIISRLVDYSRPKHSIENYGEEFGIPKGKFIDFSKYSMAMEEYCIRDVDICHKVYLKYLKYISNPLYHQSIALEHKFQLIVNDLHTNGFSFNTKKAEGLLKTVTDDLSVLDQAILKEFPPKEVLIREFTPKVTKFGTISRLSIPRLLHTKIHEYEAGKTYRHTKLVEFNPSSHKQVVEVLTLAGWSPVEKTKTFIDLEREVNKLKYSRNRTPALDLRLEECYLKIKTLEKYGWKINEKNLDTLPPSAPLPARTLAKRILLESRRRTLTEWLALTSSDNRIHGKFYGLGAWTHRMAHQKPNTANIPNEFDTQGKKKLLGKEMRSLWQAPKGRLLVGVDAEGIQLRIFAHYIDDREFTDALVHGKKSDKTDPHSLNQRILGNVCKSRQAAKRFIYALLLGAGNGKLAQILEVSENETKDALERLLERYQGFAYLKERVIPADAKRGWFLGLDGRAVAIPGDTVGGRKHLCMSGYLQNGEAVVMKAATLKWYPELKRIADETSQIHSGSQPVLAGPNAKPPMVVNFVHDEWQTEVPNNMEIALRVAEAQSRSLREVGEELHLKCPLAGSYWNEDHKDYTIGTNWSVTH